VVGLVDLSYELLLGGGVQNAGSKRRVRLEAARSASNVRERESRERERRKESGGGARPPSSVVVSGALGRRGERSAGLAVSLRCFTSWECTARRCK
jgi:hypothetical protein